MVLPKPDIAINYEQAGANTITLSTTNIALFTYLYICGNDDVTLRLTENFFHLMPGWPVTTKVTSEHKVSELKKKDKICVKTLYDAAVAVGGKLL